MSEEELGLLAKEPALLSAAAFAALNAELKRRGMAQMARPVEPRSDAPPAPVELLDFRDLPDAQVARSILRSAGIESVLLDENVIRINWLWSNAVGGIKLLVRNEDAETARSILKAAPEKSLDVTGAE